MNEIFYQVQFGDPLGPFASLPEQLFLRLRKRKGRLNLPVHIDQSAFHLVVVRGEPGMGDHAANVGLRAVSHLGPAKRHSQPQVKVFAACHALVKQPGIKKFLAGRYCRGGADGAALAEQGFKGYWFFLAFAIESFPNAFSVSYHQRIAIYQAKSRSAAQNCHLRGQMFRKPEIVRIKKCDVFSTGFYNAAIARRTRSTIFLFEVADIGTVFLKNLFQCFTIRGSIVDDNNFVVGEGLRQYRVQGGSDTSGGLVCGNDHTYRYAAPVMLGSV